MQLSDEQKKAVIRWVKEGVGISEVQRRLQAEFSLPMTYMDARFLILDLGLDVKEKPRAAVKASPAPVAGAAADEPDGEDVAPGLAGEAPVAGARVRVEVDRVMKPGSLVSGSVVFSDGVSAAWTLDQFGRLGLASSRPGYKPSRQDLQMFQDELRSALESKGF
jgi:hypothetical protein